MHEEVNKGKILIKKQTNEKQKIYIYKNKTQTKITTKKQRQVNEENVNIRETLKQMVDHTH